MHPQSAGQVLQFSPQFGSQIWSPHTLKHLFVLVIVQTILVAIVLMESDRNVQFVQLPTGVGVRSQVPALCAAHVAFAKQLIELFPVHLPAVSTQEMFVL